MGDPYYPSAAQTGINLCGLTTGVQITRNGFRPEDGFTCYEEEGFGPKCRWGDYSASFALPSGEIWSATEFIGDNARTSSPTGARSSGPPAVSDRGAGRARPPGASTPPPYHSPRRAAYAGGQRDRARTSVAV